MATYKRQPRTKKHITQQDEFINWSVRSYQWMQSHWKTVLEVVGLIVFIFIVSVGANSYSEWKQNKAAKIFFDINQVDYSDDEKIAQLNTFLKNYAQTFAGRQALMTLGNLYFKLEKYDDAAKSFTRLADAAHNQPILYIASLHRQAESLIKQTQYKKAADTYLIAAASPHNQIALNSRYLAATCYERDGAFKDAHKLYEKIISNASDDDQDIKNKSEDRILWLMAHNKLSDK